MEIKNKIPKEIQNVITNMQKEKIHYQRKVNLLNKSIKLIIKNFAN